GAVPAPPPTPAVHASAAELSEPHDDHSETNAMSTSLVAFDDAIVQALQSGCNLREIARQATETAIRLALASENGNLQRAAKRLGVTDRALQMPRAQRAD